MVANNIPNAFGMDLFSPAFSQLASVRQPIRAGGWGVGWGGAAGGDGVANLA